MKIITKEFTNVICDFNLYKLIVTIEVDNKQYVITIDNESNCSQDKYQFSVSEYDNDDVDEDILEQFQNSDFYDELCEFAKKEAISNDDEIESEIDDKIKQNYNVYKIDDHFYNNYKFTIFKHKSENDFILSVERIENNYKEQSFYHINQDDFDEDSDEVSLKEFYEFNCLNQINCSSELY